MVLVVLELSWRYYGRHDFVASSVYLGTRQRFYYDNSMNQSVVTIFTTVLDVTTIHEERAKSGDRSRKKDVACE